jgi:acetylglutamate kinase
MSDGVVVPELDAASAQQLLDNETATGGMRAKLQAAVLAANAGVSRVRIGNIDAITDPTLGTLVRGVA